MLENLINSSKMFTVNLLYFNYEKHHILYARSMSNKQIVIDLIVVRIYFRVLRTVWSSKKQNKWLILLNKWNFFAS